VATTVTLAEPARRTTSATLTSRATATTRIGIPKYGGWTLPVVPVPVDTQEIVNFQGVVSTRWVCKEPPVLLVRNL
jgi:hypothetical protein